ncbi:MAG: hypothetical protein JXA15_02080 [Spirochaetales bacterium]|nr:hypothetical protein [Spirochaetales bacterium]
MRLSVPGNLLVAGEYLVLREGGPGLALAVEPRLRAVAEGAPRWKVAVLMGSGGASWSPVDDGAREDRFLWSLLEAAERAAAARGMTLTPLELELDSRDFSRPDGRKAGFGSSAAAAVAFCLLAGKAAGLDGNALAAFALEAALDGHRAAQGGRGSGYDVYASFHGGAGLFEGGLKPRWTALPGLPVPEGRVFAGKAPVSSAMAIAAFEVWTRRESAASARLLEDSERAVRALALAPDAATFLKRLEHAREAGIAIGEAIGFPARLEAPARFEGAVVKASGAGDELGLAFFPPGTRELPAGTGRIVPTGGPAWRS